MKRKGDKDRWARYARQVVLPQIGETGQERLANGRVLIVGCGALGSIQASLLARAGMGRIIIADRDVVEEGNLQRQVLFDEKDAAEMLPKAEAAARRLRRVNSTITVKAHVLDVTARNVEGLIAKADLVFDGTDNFETRYLLNDACVKAGVPWIYGGVVGTEGLALAVHPGTGPCLRCLFPHPPPPGVLPTCETAGVLNTVPAVVAAFQVTEGLKHLAGGPETEAPRLLRADPWHGEIRLVEIRRNEACPCCGKREFSYLEGKGSTPTAVLCGRYAVQVSPPEPVRLDLEQLLRRLKRAGEAESNGLMIRFRVEGHELILFPDGRAIVKGTDDEALARSLYARYVGH